MLLAHTRSMFKPRLVLDSEIKTKRNVNVLTWEIAIIRVTVSTTVLLHLILYQHLLHNQKLNASFQ